MNKTDWEGAYPDASQGFEDAMQKSLEATRAAQAANLPRPFRGSRRLIWALLLLLLGTATAVGVLDRGYNLMQQEQYDTDKSMAVIGDTLYVTDGFKLLSYAPGQGDYITRIHQVIRHDSLNAPEQKPLRKSAHYIDLLLNIDGRLCGMNGKSGLLFEIGWENGEAIYQNKRKLKLEYNMCRGSQEDLPRSMTSPVVQDNTLYFVQRDQYADTEYRVAAYDLTTGDGGLKKVKNVRLLAPYREGKLLAVTQKSDAEDEILLCVYDPSGDTLRRVCDLGGLPNARRLDGLEYSQSKDCAYLFDTQEGVVYRLPGLKKPEKIALISNIGFCNAEYGRSSALVEDEFYCAQDRKGLYVRNLEAGYQAPLAIREENSTALSEDALRAASQASGLESTLSWASRSQSPTLQELLLTRDNQYDIYLFTTTGQDLEHILSKGYAPSAPDLLHLNQLEEALYPFLREALSAKGRLAAVPLGISVSASYVNKDVLARLGLEEAPGTPEELLALLEPWAGGAFPNLETGDRPLAANDYREELIHLTLALHSQACAARKIPVSLKDPALLAALSAIDQVDLRPVNEALYWSDELGAEMDAPLNCLLSINENFQTSPWGNVSLHPFSLDGSRPAAACEVTVAIVNPFGKRQAEAWELLNAYVNAMPRENRAMLCPGENQPVENPSFPAIQEDLLSLIAEFEAAKNQDAANDYRAELAEMEKYNRYAFSAENMAVYRALMENAYVTAPSVLDGESSGEWGALLSRYMDGKITLEQFSQEGTARLSLMQRE